MNLIKRLSLLILLISAVLGLGLSSVVSAQEELTDSELELANGDILVVKVLAVTEEGVVFDFVGNQMQLDWTLLRAERFLADRRALIDQTSAESWDSFSQWCQGAGLPREKYAAEVEAAKLKGAPIPPEPKWEGEEGPPDAAGDDSRPDDAASRDPAAKDKPAPRPKSVTLNIDDRKLLSAVRKRLRQEGVRIKSRRADLKVMVKDFKFEEVKNKEFFGETIRAVFKLSCSVEIVTSSGTTVAKSTFTSGDQDSTKSKNDAQSKCRDELLKKLLPWVSKRLTAES